MKWIFVVMLLIAMPTSYSLAQVSSQQSMINFSAGQVFPLTEGFIDAHGVLIYYKSVGRGEPLVILHGGPGASHDYFCIAARRFESAFNLVSQPIVGRQSTALHKLIYPGAELIYSVHHAPAIKAGSPLGFEQIILQDLHDRLVGGPVIVKLFPHAAEYLKLSVARNSHATMHRGRTQVNQNAVRFEHPVCFVQGMNHALLGHSSQGPRENCQVK